MAKAFRYYMAASIRLRRLPLNEGPISKSGNRNDDLRRGVAAFRSEMDRAKSPPIILKIISFAKENIIPIDPVGPHCYRGGTKPC